MIPPKQSSYLLLFYIGALAVIYFIPLFGGTVAINHQYVAGMRADYMLHVLAFLPWIPLWSFAFPGIRVSRLLLVLAGGVVLAAGLEWLQHLTGWRTYNPLDILSNVVGLVVGGVAVLLGKGNRKQGTRNKQQLN